MAGENATYRQVGDTIDYTPGSAVASGDVIVLTDIIGIAKTPIAANELGSLGIDGVFSVPKGSDAFTIGDTVHWDPDATTANGQAVNASATGTTVMGVAVAAAGSGLSTVSVKINAI